jgi:hypothetical protein
MDDLAQHSPWRALPLRDEAAPPFDSPIVFGVAPVALQPAEPRGEPRPYAHRLGTAQRGTPRIFSLIS